jgi:hypothetical protein
MFHSSVNVRSNARIKGGHAVINGKRVLPSGAMRSKILDTFVRISKGTRAKLNAHCVRHNLQQGHFADTAILAAIHGGHAPSTIATLAIPSNSKAARLPTPELPKRRKSKKAA